MENEEKKEESITSQVVDKVEENGDKIKNVENKEKELRKIVILTDGDTINLSEANVSGKIELIAILETLTLFLKQQTKTAK